MVSLSPITKFLNRTQKLLPWQLRQFLSGFNVNLSQKSLIVSYRTFFFVCECAHNLFPFSTFYNVLIQLCDTAPHSKQLKGNIVDFWQWCQEKASLMWKLRRRQRESAGAEKKRWREGETRGEDDTEREGGRGLFKRDILMNEQSFGPLAVQLSQKIIDF